MILRSGPDFGVTANGFGFLISWATNAAVVVEASPSLAAPVWTPVSTNTLTAGTSQFTDPQWTNHPAASTASSRGERSGSVESNAMKAQLTRMKASRRKTPTELFDAQWTARLLLWLLLFALPAAVQAQFNYTTENGQITITGYTGPGCAVDIPSTINGGPGFGVGADGFGFLISWAPDASVVVEAGPDLAAPVWSPVSTNTLTSGTSQFTDPQWTNYPNRFYRVQP
ncbi:MAG TPA: hypothetical protein PLX89_06200 [Verrucomicrobiota bacterium]|nr:hypothetical protein [Verrucomicrobiota bacterium]